jgi:hypothetical protein
MEVFERRRNFLSRIVVNNQHDAQFFSMYVYFYSLHVSGSHVPIIRRINYINTTSGICHDIYQMLHWYNWFSWWLAHVCPKHVENRNKHTWKRIVRQVGYLQGLYRDAARSAEHKITVQNFSGTYTWLRSSSSEQWCIPKSLELIFNIISHFHRSLLCGLFPSECPPHLPSLFIFFTYFCFLFRF